MCTLGVIDHTQSAMIKSQSHVSGYRRNKIANIYWSFAVQCLERHKQNFIYPRSAVNITSNLIVLASGRNICPHIVQIKTTRVLYIPLSLGNYLF